MMIPLGKVDQALGAHLHKIYKTHAAAPVAKTESARDELKISQYSTLVDLGRAKALSLPEVRQDKVNMAKMALQNGSLPNEEDIAAALINRAVKKQV